MIVVVDPHSGVPVYRQLIDQIKFHVASGLLEPGDELPSTRALSARIGVNPMTISKAFRQLEQEGVVERRPGLPSIIRPMPAEALATSRLAQLRASLEPVATRARQLGVEFRVGCPAACRQPVRQPVGRRTSAAAGKLLDLLGGEPTL